MNLMANHPNGWDLQRKASFPGLAAREPMVELGAEILSCVVKEWVRQRTLDGLPGENPCDTTTFDVPAHSSVG